MMNHSAILLTNIILAVIGIALCSFLNVPSAIIFSVCIVLIILINEIYEQKRKKMILHMCDEINKILKGEENINLDSYNENELSLLCSDIHKMTIKIREKNSMLISEKKFMKESLEDIAHQLRTPQTAMTLLLDVMKKNIDEPRKQVHNIREMESMLSRMKWLVDTMLTISRADADAIKFQRNEISCRELIKASSEPLLISMELKSISFVCRIEGEPAFKGDFRYIRESITNILKNSMEHTPENGSIEIIAKENPMYTNIVIKDTGEGISDEQLNRIFERFYSSNTGYGIGLSFAKKIITKNNGILQIKSNAPCGTVFDIRFYKTVV